MYDILLFYMLLGWEGKRNSSKARGDGQGKDGRVSSLDYFLAFQLRSPILMMVEMTCHLVSTRGDFWVDDQYRATQNGNAGSR